MIKEYKKIFTIEAFKKAFKGIRKKIWKRIRVKVLILTFIILLGLWAEMYI